MLGFIRALWKKALLENGEFRAEGTGFIAKEADTGLLFQAPVYIENALQDTKL